MAGAPPICPFGAQPPENGLFALYVNIGFIPKYRARVGDLYGVFWGHIGLDIPRRHSILKHTHGTSLLIGF